MGCCEADPLMKDLIRDQRFNRDVQAGEVLKEGISLLGRDPLSSLCDY
jgi:hypothetical protein